MNKMQRFLGLNRCTLLLCFFLMCSGASVMAASKAKPFSKKYKNERLEVVLNDLCKHNGYKLNIIDPDIDLDKRITEEFKNARTAAVLKKVLDKDVQGKVKKGNLNISRLPQPPVTFMVPGTVVAEEVDNDSVNIKTYQDTTFSVTCKWVTLTDTVIPEQQPTKESKVQHYFQVLLGGGYGSLGYDLGDAGSVKGGFAGNVQLRYLCYFHPNWGVGIGVGFSNYSSLGKLDTRIDYYNPADVVMPQTDSESEAYGHSVRLKGWEEKQNAYMVDVPIMIQCSYPLNKQLKNGPLKIYADLGVNLGLCVAANRQLKGGSVEHIGWYKPWNLTLEQITGHDFYTEQAEAFGDGKEKLTLKMPAVGLMADFGFEIPVTQNMDVMVGVYMNYTVNNVCDSKSDLGWRQASYSGDLAYRNHDWMNTYPGIVGCQFADKVHPWQAGVRVGLNIHVQKKEKPVEPEYIFTRNNVCDTTYTLQPRVVTTVKPKAVVQIKRALEKAVIWFDLNSVEPKLEPADILVKVADILKENPDQKIMVTGHASKEGNKELNQRLSENRAKAIVDMLIELGVQPQQIQSQAKGIDVDYIKGDHDISLDRRAEITPIEEEPAPVLEAPVADEAAETPAE